MATLERRKVTGKGVWMQPCTTKGKATRAHLLDTALTCFAESGYRESSMRTIAQRAGVSLSHAYYYFDSKEAIVGHLLLNLRTEQYRRCKELLGEGNTLEANIRIVFKEAIEVLRPYHDFGPAFMQVLRSATQDATDAQREGIELALWRQVVDEARPLPPLGIRKDLPRFLWLVSRQLMSVWAYDSSETQRRSRALAIALAPVIAKFAVLCRLPVVRSLFTDVMELMDSTAGAAERDPSERLQAKAS
ncbi:TetR/AcrR family transcriptional regulator [Glutamicibacter endophyticus]